MKIKDYILDRILYIFGFICMLLLVSLILNVTNTSFSTRMFIVAVISMFFMIDFIYVYIKKASYYNKLTDTLNHLDKKYLLTELVDKPNFLDGKIMYNILQELDKNMHDYINTYMFRQKEYKDYIEMWVHEIKTPIAAANLLIENHPSMISDQLKEELSHVEDHVEQALYYARSTTLEKDYMIKQLNLQKVIHTVIRKYSKNFIYNRIAVELKDLDVTVYSDSKWLGFIISQIIGNCLKYMDKENSKVTIYTKKEENHILLFIDDNGIGIAEQDLPRIFERGFTGINGRENSKTTGMGLYLCKTLCDKMSLSISCHSELNKGTSICISFPCDSRVLF